MSNLFANHLNDFFAEAAAYYLVCPKSQKFYSRYFFMCKQKTREKQITVLKFF